MLPSPRSEVALVADPDPAILDALSRDPPQDHAHPAETRPTPISSGGVNLNAIFYTAAGAGPHPTVLLLHGLPGNEQNIDLAQAIRRAGWNVLTLHYRGSWGTPGSFSFEHCLEDAAAAVDWLLGGAADRALRIDPDRLVVIGHSMGGYVAAHVAAERTPVIGVALISPANLGTAFGMLPHSQAISVVDDNVGASAGLHILSGTSPEALASEARDNADRWRLENHSAAMSSRPVLLITSDDGFGEGSEPFAKAAAASGRLTRAHLSTDHSYSDQRIALQTEVLRWLSSRLNKDPPWQSI